MSRYGGCIDPTRCVSTLLEILGRHLHNGLDGDAAEHVSTLLEILGLAKRPRHRRHVAEVVSTLLEILDSPHRVCAPHLLRTVSTLLEILGELINWVLNAKVKDIPVLTLLEILDA